MFLLAFAIFGFMDGWSNWSWGNPFYARQQQQYSSNNNEAVYQNQRGNNWKTYTQVAVPVLGAATALGALGWALKRHRKREVVEPFEKKVLSRRVRKK